VTRPDGTLKTAAELQEEADRLIRDARARGERVRSELAGNVAEATSTNQAATVAVTATGGLQSVRLNDRIKQLGPAQVAASIMEAYQKASGEALARTAEITGREIGEDRARAMFRDLLNRDLPDDDADGRSRA
jgi:hypothetical protein